jgi:hypothetical protein
MQKLIVTLEVAKNAEEAKEKADVSMKHLVDYFIFDEYAVLGGDQHATEWGRFTEAPYALTANDKKKLSQETWEKPVSFGKKPEAFDLLQTLFMWQLQERKKYILQIRQGIVIRDIDEIVHEEDSDLREAFKKASCSGTHEHVYSEGRDVCTKRELQDLMKAPKGSKVFVVPVIVECLEEKVEKK